MRIGAALVTLALLASGSSLACSSQEGAATATDNASRSSDEAAELLALATLTLDPIETALPDRLAGIRNGIAGDSPLWPQAVFLRAELRLAAGDTAGGRALHRQLAEWAAGDPYQDGLGGSSLAIFALWRWVQGLHVLALSELGSEASSEIGSDPGAGLRSELEAALAAHARLADTPFARSVFAFGFLDALPALRADLLRRLAATTWRAGAVEDARRLFLAYLELGPDEPLGEGESRLLGSLLASGDLAAERVTELQARRLERLRRLDEALPLWEWILADGKPSQRDTARLEIAKLKGRLFAAGRSEVAGLLTTVIEQSADPAIVQEALSLRAAAWQREGSGQNLQRHLSDLTRLIERFPDGTLADDALFRLASHYQRRYEAHGQADDLDRALGYFERLRAFQGPNDWSDSAYFQPAMALYSRGAARDLERARALLEELATESPDGPLRRGAEFWRARILEDLGRHEEKVEIFRRLIAERPYDYHALRSRLHLALGGAARGVLWPDAEIRAVLRSDHDRHPAPTAPADTSRYHSRLAVAVETGLYGRLVESRGKLRARFPGERIQNLSLARLEEAEALAPLALLLSLRQDALAAAERASEVTDRLGVHAAVGLEAGDLPLAMSMAIGSLGSSPGPATDPRFLRTAYPPAHAEIFVAAARAEAVPPELLYALSRRESLFDPSAISTFSALGLFQFIPSTFEALDERWKLLEGSGVTDPNRFLLDPQLNAGLGARWLADELIFRQNCVLLTELGRSCNAPNRADPRLALVTDGTWFEDSIGTRQQRVVLLALMEHSRGYRAVRGWLDRWRREGRAEDLEYMIETAGAAETRILVRGVVTDASIAASIGLFEP